MKFAINRNYSEPNQISGGLIIRRDADLLTQKTLLCDTTCNAKLNVPHAVQFIDVRIICERLFALTNDDHRSLWSATSSVGLTKIGI